MHASKLLDPVDFRFTDPRDVERYGDRWYRYAEGDLARLPAQTLIGLEAELGMPIVDVMNGMRMSSVLGDTAAAWIGVRDVDPKLAGPFSEFNPITMLIDWRPASEGKAEGTTAQEELPGLPPPPADGSRPLDRSSPPTSGPTDTVALPTLPVSG
jgi:hypothetical protein